MEIAELYEFILGGGLLAAVITIATMRSKIREEKAKAAAAEADAEKMKADAEGVRLDNTEHATRILLDNILKPLIENLNETKTELELTKRELSRNTREMARFRVAINRVGDCDYRMQCPVLDELRKRPKDSNEHRGNREGSAGQPACRGGHAGDIHACGVVGGEDGTGHGKTAEPASRSILSRKERSGKP